MRAKGAPKRKPSPRVEPLEDRTLLSSLTLSIAASSIVENAGPAATTGTVTRVGADNTVPMTVSLSSSDTSKAAVPASVVIPANQTSATFNIDAVDQDLVAGDETVTISASGQVPSSLSLDSTFGSGGVVSQAANTTALALQSDGKIITIYGGSALYVSRYNTDGSIDTSFGGTGTVSVDASGASSDQAEAVAIQADGKIVVGGIGGPGPHFNFILARFNSDGTLDTTFGNGGSELSVLSNGYYNELWDLAIQSDGHILAVGNVDYTQSGGGFDLAVVRYNSNGALDTTFGSNGVAGVVPNHGGRAFGVAQQANGDIVIAGEDGGGNSYSEFAVARFTPTGQLDSTFGTGGKVLTDIPGDYEQGQDVTIQPDGKLIVVGQVGQTGVFPPKYDVAMARYNTDGSLDTSFGSSGIVVTTEGGVYSRMGVALQGTGQIIVSGNNGTKAGLLRYNPDGSLDTSNFTSSSGTAGFDTLVQPDGLILLIGANGPYNGFLERYVGDTVLPASATLTVTSDESNSAPVLPAYIPLPTA
jgi:uncharacterized delta-60 repeat protein